MIFVCRQRLSTSWGTFTYASLCTLHAAKEHDVRKNAVFRCSCLQRRLLVVGANLARESLP